MNGPLQKCLNFYTLTDFIDLTERQSRLLSLWMVSHKIYYISMLMAVLSTNIHTMSKKSQLTLQRLTT